MRNPFAVGRNFAPARASIPPAALGPEAAARSREPVAPFMERHRAITLVLAVVILVLTGLLVGKGLGTVGVHVINAVLPHTSSPA